MLMLIQFDIIMMMFRYEGMKKEKRIIVKY